MPILCSVGKPGDTVSYIPPSVWGSSHQDESASGFSSTSFRDGKEELWQECCFPALPHGVTNSLSTIQHMTHMLGSGSDVTPRTRPRGCKLPSGLAGFYFQSSLCGLPASFISLTFVFPSAALSPITVVCYQSDRDELRRRVIQWLEAEIIPDGWFSKGSNYSEVLDKYFKASRAAPASEPKQHFLPCHCKTAAMPPAERLQCVMHLSNWGPEGSDKSYSLMCYGLPAAATD